MSDARSPRIGYALAAAAATMWALNGSIARYLLDDGMAPLRLAQLRAAISFVVLAVVLALWRPRLLRVRRDEVGPLVVLGIGGLAMVHATYFLAIDRLQIGVALALQYLGPLLILLWLRAAHGRRLPPGLWAAMGLALIGSAFVVEAYDPGALDGLGVLAGLGAAVTYAFYLVEGERAGHGHEPVTTLAWAFGAATVFWAVVLPWWSFPWEHLDSGREWLLGLGVGIVGTLAPFVCMITALRLIPATRASIVATLEPVLAAIIAFAVHGEVLGVAQIAGGMAVVAAVAWVQVQGAPGIEERVPERLSTRAQEEV
jgi:drug/metabolite transporter (DMT)-like permease